MSSDKILNISSPNFEQALVVSVPVLVDFWAPWCGPCRSIAPILDELASELDGRVRICKVNVDDNQDIAQRFNIRAIPTLLIFKDGKVVEQIVGLVSKPDLMGKILAHA